MSCCHSSSQLFDVDSANLLEKVDIARPDRSRRNKGTVPTAVCIQNYIRRTRMWPLIRFFDPTSSDRSSTHLSTTLYNVSVLWSLFCGACV